jgi:hypothetical protein
MPHSPEPAQSTRRRAYLAVAILIAAGYGLTFLVFYPGVNDLRCEIRLRGHCQTCAW